MSKAEMIDGFCPFDVVACQSCKMAFRVSKLEYEEPYVIDWDTEYEYVPNYCPQCGGRIRAGKEVAP